MQIFYMSERPRFPIYCFLFPIFDGWIFLIYRFHSVIL